jgi:predicted alpha/beta-hydrolase family hydrolase
VEEGYLGCPCPGEISMKFAASTPNLLTNGPKRAKSTIILAHGAGASMDTDFMNAFADGLAKRGLRVVRFEFPYMAAKRETGKSRPPDREPVLRETWHHVIGAVKSDHLFIGGKSMGGRIASLVADEANVAGLVCLGYPFHPTGKSKQLRIEHLKTIRTPTLIVQGERDPFGTREEVAAFKLSKQVRLHWLRDGDHGFKPRKSSGRTLEENWAEGISAVASFMSK